MQDKILIAYATKMGSTAEIAKYISQILEDKGFAVDLLPVAQVKEVEKYQKIYLGSPIYLGKWKKAARKFIKQQQTVLQNKEVYFWLSCMSLAEDDAAKSAAVEGYLATERQLLSPLSEGRFAGKLEREKLSFLERKMIKAVGSPLGDFRNWDEIAAWTNSTLAG